MSIHRHHRIGRSTVQRLLRGEPVGPAKLTDLLVTVAAPAGRDELAGEEAAVSAFREAHLLPALQQRRTPVIKTALAKLLTIKVAAAALTVTAAGGVALAAGTGHMPGSQGGAAPTGRPTATNDTGTHHTGKPSTARDGHHSASPFPSLVGLCNAYQASAGGNPGKALDNPAFTHLITVAGGKDKVAAYCTGLTKQHPGKSRASHPADAHTHPTATTPAHRTGAPATHPRKSVRPVH